MKIKIVDKYEFDSTDTENQTAKVVGKNAVVYDENEQRNESVSLGEVKKIDRSTGSTIIHGVGWHLIIEHKSGIKHKIEGSL